MVQTRRKKAAVAAEQSAPPPPPPPPQPNTPVKRAKRGRPPKVRPEVTPTSSTLNGSISTDFDSQESCESFVTNEADSIMEKPISKRRSSAKIKIGPIKKLPEPCLAEAHSSTSSESVKKVTRRKKDDDDQEVAKKEVEEVDNEEIPADPTVSSSCSAPEVEPEKEQESIPEQLPMEEIPPSASSSMSPGPDESESMDIADSESENGNEADEPTATSSAASSSGRVSAAEPPSGEREIHVDVSEGYNSTVPSGLPSWE
uniref:Uncharacterized protein n=1 Tax=Caenorhabditis japonica TaxID=281687 RepID=A0A8R1IB81_CAEJA